MPVTADQVKEAVAKAGLTKIDHHDCSLCGVMTCYTVRDGELFFNSACGCSYSPPRHCSWDEAADYINMQTRKSEKWGDVGARIAKQFGIELEPAD